MQGSQRLMTTVKCPTCSAPVEWGPQSPYRPFCSKRCKLIDLGGWLDGSHRIPGEELPDSQGEFGAPGLPDNDEAER